MCYFPDFFVRSIVAMASSSQLKVEQRVVNLRSVPAVVPTNDEEKQLLANDLTTMGCEGLLAQPWAMRSEALVREFWHPQSNEWEGTLRRLPELWTADKWAEVYSFRKAGRLKARRTDTWVDGKFRSPINSKDGHSVEDCIDPRERRVLEFVVPILYPEKPSRVTKEIGNTIFGSLAGEYKVNWGHLIQEVVSHLVSNLEKGKASPISPYLFHLYYRNECLREEEMREVEVARDCLEYGVGPDAPPDDEDLGSESVGSEEKRKLTSSRVKHTNPSPRGKSPIRSPELSALELDDDPCLRLQGEVDRVTRRYAVMEAVIRKASQLLGDCKTGNLLKELKKLTEKNTEALEKENRMLKEKVETLKYELAMKEDDVQKYKTLRMEAILEIREVTGHPGDILNKARLFTEYVQKSIAPTLPKIIAILHGYHKKMEGVLVEVRTLVSGTAGESTRPLFPSRSVSPNKGKRLEEFKTPPAPRPAKESSTGGSDVVAMVENSPIEPPVIPTPNVPVVSTPSVVPDVPRPQDKPEASVPKAPVAKSPTPSPRKLSLRQPWTPTRQVLELGESTEGSAGEEEEEESSPREGRTTRSSEKKKTTSSSQAPKRQVKSAGKGEPSSKRTRRVS